MGKKKSVNLNAEAISLLNKAKQKFLKLNPSRDIVTDSDAIIAALKAYAR